MSSIALAFRSLGNPVAGYDSTRSENTALLEEKGVAVSYEFRREDFDGVDLVVYTNAIKESDPVFIYPKSLGIPMITRAAALGHLMKRYRDAVGVAGTHGKSTTTGMLSYIFICEDRSPTIFAGAHLPILGGNYQIGTGKEFIFEACEYQDSFLQFFPTVAVVLNVAFDHADYFLDLNDVVSSFSRYLFLVQGDGTAVINRDDAGARAAAQGYTGRQMTFSKESMDATVCARHLYCDKGFYSFDVYYKGEFYTKVKLGVPGEFNVSNALAAICVAILWGVSKEAIVTGLKAFGGVKRRFEVRGKLGDAVVVDDYAHHPDEIRATLGIARSMGYERVTVVFQSHTFSRTRACFDEICSAFEEGCDEVIYADIYPAREKPIEGINAKALANKTKNGVYLGDNAAIAEHLKNKKRKQKGLIIVMGAGDIVSLTPSLLEVDDAH